MIPLMLPKYAYVCISVYAYVYVYLCKFWKKLLIQCLPIKKGSMDFWMGAEEDLNFSSYTILYCLTFNHVYLWIHCFLIIKKEKIF